jgi:hypothetical protein
VVLDAPAMVDTSEPVVVALTVVNDGPLPVAVPRDLSPESGNVHVYIERPDGQIVEHKAPTYRLVAPEDVVLLAPGERHVTPIQLSFSAHGPEFVNPGTYRARAVLTPDGEAMLPSNDVRVRVANPTSRAVEELTEVVTRPEVAKFLYFGGSARRPGLADDLTDVAERFEQDSPATVAHLRTALGRHAARDTKVVRVADDGARSIGVRRADPATAVRQLEAGIELARRHGTLPAVAVEPLSEVLDHARSAAGKRSPGKGAAKKAPAKKATAKKADASRKRTPPKR